MTEPACTAAVHSDGTTALPATGADAALVMPLTILAAIAIAVGLVLLFRSGRARTLAAAVFVVLAASASALPPVAAHAAPAAPCALIRIDAVTAPSLDALLPGESADGLRYRITNVSDAPIEVRVSTVVTSDSDGLADVVRAAITLGGSAASPRALSDGPAAPSLALGPGSSATAAYTLTIPSSITDDRQGQTLTFDSVVDAAQQ